MFKDSTIFVASDVDDLINMGDLLFCFPFLIEIYYVFLYLLALSSLKILGELAALDSLYMLWIDILPLLFLKDPDFLTLEDICWDVFALVEQKSFVLEDFSNSLGVLRLLDLIGV